jgi:large subunit ribosomal protein L19
METAIKNLEQSHRKPALPQVMSGDTVRVHQLIREGSKQRIQIFEGVVIRRHRLGELTATITVRRIASNVGVEKTFLMHSPNVSKIEILRRAKVRRNFLSYLRERRGKSARLKEIAFDKIAANDVSVPEVPSEEIVDQTVTEIDTSSENDALNDAVSLDGEEKAEERAARSEDESSVATDVDQSNEADAPAQEIEQGLTKADPKDEKAL